MEKFDARKLPLEAQDEMRWQAMRMREELNLSWKKIARVVAERKEQIEVFYLPLYSPEINPDEYLNRDFKTELRSSDHASSKKALLSKVTTFMERLVKTPERVVAYLKHSAVQYEELSPI